MTTKIISLGQEFSVNDCTFGIGSIYLAGPSNTKWKEKFITELKVQNFNGTVFVPIYSDAQYNVFKSKEEIDEWNEQAISMASSIVFWFPTFITKEIKPFVDFGRFCNSERVFLGLEKSDIYNNCMEHLLYQKHKLYPAETVEDLVAMVVHWLKE